MLHCPSCAAHACMLPWRRSIWNCLTLLLLHDRTEFHQANDSYFVFAFVTPTLYACSKLYVSCAAHACCLGGNQANDSYFICHLYKVYKIYKGLQSRSATASLAIFTPTLHACSKLYVLTTVFFCSSCVLPWRWLKRSGPLLMKASSWWWGSQTQVLDDIYHATHAKQTQLKKASAVLVESCHLIKASSWWWGSQTQVLDDINHATRAKQT